MLATELQQLLNVEDQSLILYGYTFPPSSLGVYFFFENGELVRHESSGNELYVHKNTLVTPEHLFAGVKRFYRQGTNENLRRFVASFRDYPLPEVDGGSHVTAGDFICC